MSTPDSVQLPVAEPETSRRSLRAWFHDLAAELGRQVLVLELEAERRRNPRAFAGLEAVWPKVVVSPEARQLHRAVVVLAPLQRAVVMADFAAGGTASAERLARTLRTTPNSIYVTRNAARNALREVVPTLLPRTNFP